ncbi:MAG TPA: ATP-binding protein [Archangium sp.]|nr:ATP-binding protein [Archangium sp.]
MAVIGGVNGSGKTTLLNFIAKALHLLVEHPDSIPEVLLADEAFIDFKISGGEREIDPGEVRFLLGNKKFFEQHQTAHCFGYQLTGGRPKRIAEGRAASLQRLLSNRTAFAASSLPSLLYIPSEFRTLQIPYEEFKSPGKMPAPSEFVYQWMPAQTWNQSLEARLYSARWEDLNAKEEGRPEEARHFEAYANAFQIFTGRSKALVWKSGELAIELKDDRNERTRHSLWELSSGEKEVLILASELLLRWRRGSLVMIDEPELHLHPAWQLRLWQVLLDFRRERGGQIIIATQSPHLFGAAEIGTKLLMGSAQL